VSRATRSAARFLVFVVCAVCAAFAAGCDGGPVAIDAGAPTASVTPPPSSSPSQTESGPGLPPTYEGSATGLCAQWSVRPLDLSMLPPPDHTASLAARADGRGGVTVWIVDPSGAVTAASFAAGGSIDGAPVTLAHTTVGASDGGLSTPLGIYDVVAIPAGWVASWQGDRQQPGFIDVYDARGNAVSSVALETNAATVGVGADGSLGVDDGASIGWIRPGQATEQLVFTYDAVLLSAFQAGCAGCVTDPALFSAWAGDVAYASSPDLSPNVETVAPDGSQWTFPGAPTPTSCHDDQLAIPPPSVLLPGIDARSAVIVAPPCWIDDGPVALQFASAAYALRAFAFDGPIPRGTNGTRVPLGVAGRVPSGGVLLAWAAATRAGSTDSPLGLAEVAPSGARGALVTLGEMSVAPTRFVLGGSNDGGTYVAVASNASVRASFVVTCAE